MAKNKDKKSDAASAPRPEQILQAVEQALAGGLVRERVQELADEFVGAANRVRGLLEETAGQLRGEDAGVDELKAQISTLEARVAELEAKQAAPKRASSPRKSTATKRSSSGRSSASKSSASKSSASKSSAAKSRATKSSGTSSSRSPRSSSS